MTQLPKVSFWGLRGFFLYLGKLKGLVSFGTERKMQIPQSERSLISGSHPSHVLCVFQTDLTPLGFIAQTLETSLALQLNEYKHVQNYHVLLHVGKTGFQGKCLHYLTCELFLSCWWAKRRGAKGVIFNIFKQLFWGRTCLSNRFWKRHNICTIKTILLSQRLFQRELSWNYTYLGASQCQQAENAAFFQPQLLYFLFVFTRKD